MGMLLTWFPFLYFEMTFRFNHVPQYLLNISRPFAAHWCVVCMCVCVYVCTCVYVCVSSNVKMRSKAVILWCYVITLKDDTFLHTYILSVLYNNGKVYITVVSYKLSR